MCVYRVYVCINPVWRGVLTTCRWFLPFVSGWHLNACSLYPFDACRIHAYVNGNLKLSYAADIHKLWDRLDARYTYIAKVFIAKNECIYRWRRMCFVLEMNTLALDMNTFSAKDECLSILLFLSLILRAFHCTGYSTCTSKFQTDLMLRWLLLTSTQLSTWLLVTTFKYGMRSQGSVWKWQCCILETVLSWGLPVVAHAYV